MKSTFWLYVLFLLQLTWYLFLCYVNIILWVWSSYSSLGRKVILSLRETYRRVWGKNRGLWGEKRRQNPSVSKAKETWEESSKEVQPLGICRNKSSLKNSSNTTESHEMAENVEQTLCSTLMSTEFLLDLDESILLGNESLLLPYMGFIKDKSLAQELLFARQVRTDTQGNQYSPFLSSYLKARKLHLLTYLTGHYCGHVNLLGGGDSAKVSTIHCIILQ